MLTLITVLIIGAVAAFVMILAASMLSSQISSMEGDYMFDEPTVHQADLDSSAP